MQQRAIPGNVVELLVAYGKEEHDHHGGMVLYFDKMARHRLARDFKARKLGFLDRYQDAYAVVSLDGEIITVGHRDKRIRKH
ncbi:MAG: hypothetical protein HS110_10115 [Zoogloeaceae bacterium]|nr:hypothetical protein [Zoogloeaceae bacterium]MCK6383914.1 hypothetical protein [Rhodocyclaceae bacterium]